MSRKRTAPQVLDYAGMPEVVTFMYRQLCRMGAAGYNVRKLGRVTLDDRLTSSVEVDGDSENLWGRYRIKASFNRLAKYPIRWPSAQATLQTPAEALVITLGHEVWHFLCDSKQENSGGRGYEERKKREEADAWRMGRDWLRRWRCGRRGK